MGNPILTPITENSFMDGSAVYANDVAIKGEIEGNIELSNIAESKSLYTMCVGPIFFGPSRGDLPWVTPVVWTTSSVSILAWRVPRALTVHAIQLHVDNRQVGGDAVGNPSASSGFVLNTSSNITITVEYSDDVAGAYTVSSGTAWTEAAVLEDINWVENEDGDATTGETKTTSTLASPKTIPAGKYARVALSSTNNPTIAAVKRTRAIITVTLYVSEDHLE